MDSISRSITTPQQATTMPCHASQLKQRTKERKHYTAHFCIACILYHTHYASLYFITRCLVCLMIRGHSGKMGEVSHCFLLNSLLSTPQMRISMREMREMSQRLAKGLGLLVSPIPRNITPSNVGKEQIFAEYTKSPTLYEPQTSPVDYNKQYTGEPSAHETLLKLKPLYSYTASLISYILNTAYLPSLKISREKPSYCNRDTPIYHHAVQDKVHGNGWLRAPNHVRRHALCKLCGNGRGR